MQHIFKFEVLLRKHGVGWKSKTKLEWDIL